MGGIFPPRRWAVSCRHHSQFQLMLPTDVVQLQRDLPQHQRCRVWLAFINELEGAIAQADVTLRQKPCQRFWLRF